MELLEYGLIALGMTVTFLGLYIVLGKTGSKRVTKDSTVSAWKEVSKEKEIVIKELQGELSRVRGKASRALQQLNEYQSSTIEDNDEDKDEVNLDNVKPLIKMLKPNATDLEMDAAMQIPQVKELLGNIGTNENLELIKKIAPLLTKKNDEQQIQNQDNWA